MKRLLVCLAVLLLACGNGQAPDERDAAMSCAQSLVPDGEIRSLDRQDSTGQWAATGEIIEDDKIFVFVVTFELPCKKLSLAIK